MIRLAFVLLLGLSISYDCMAKMLMPPAVYRQVMSDHAFTLPISVIDKGVVYKGSGYKLKRVIADLLRGEPVHVGVIGGSVSWGHGASRRGHTDWFSLFVTWLRTTFPNAKVVGRNGCIPATKSQLALYCTEQIVDREVDLVFMEFAINDGMPGTMQAGADYLVNPNTIIQERLARKLLDHPHKPAVVYMHFLQACHGQQWVMKYNIHPCWFHQSPEDMYNVIAQYYDLPVLSLRDVVWHHAMRNVSGFHWADILAEDQKHGNDKGYRLMADMAVRLVQQVAMDLHARAYSHEDDWHARHEPLPPPLFKNNFAPTTRCCAYQDDLQPYVVSSTGWSWVNEGTEEKPKKGYVTHAPGAVIKLKVPLVRDFEPIFAGVNGMGAEVVEARKAGRSYPTTAFVAYLKSWNAMGRAALVCEGGCACTPAAVDAGKDHRQQSQTYLARLDITPQDPPGECYVNVRVLEGTSTNGTKFKVAGLMVVGEPAFSMDTVGFHFGEPFEVFEQGSGKV